MSFPWPVIDDDLVLDDALGIALRHLDLPADEEQYAELFSRDNASHHNERPERILDFAKINAYHVSLVPYCLGRRSAESPCRPTAAGSEDVSWSPGFSLLCASET